MKTLALGLSFALALAGSAAAQHVHTPAEAEGKTRPPSFTAPAPSRPKVAFNHRRMMERAGYKKVSSLVNFPSFFPGIGVLYVKPDTLPAGPFLAYDRKDRLVSTIYMIPVEDLANEKKFDLKAISERSDHVTLYYNAGHAGVEMPHYHVVVWHVSKKDEARVAR